MGKRRKYRKKAGQYVVALQLTLGTTGFTYRKRGADQRCKKDDWIIDNGGDVYMDFLNSEFISNNELLQLLKSDSQLRSNYERL